MGSRSNVGHRRGSPISFYGTGRLSVVRRPLSIRRVGVVRLVSAMTCPARGLAYTSSRGTSRSVFHSLGFTGHVNISSFRESFRSTVKEERRKNHRKD